MNQRSAEHEQLRQSMSQFATLLQSSYPADRSELLRERLRFSQIFCAHLDQEHNDVAKIVMVNPKIRMKTAGRAEIISQLRLDYSIHIRHWTPVMIQSSWAEYRRAVLLLQNRLRILMDWEERNLPIYH